jgi:hypothetical protein
MGAVIFLRCTPRISCPAAAIPVRWGCRGLLRGRGEILVNPVVGIPSPSAPIVLRRSVGPAWTARSDDGRALPAGIGEPREGHAALVMERAAGKLHQ